jgi:hypothetical protein
LNSSQAWRVVKVRRAANRRRSNRAGS